MRIGERIEQQGTRVHPVRAGAGVCRRYVRAHLCAQRNVALFTASMP
jgi:hypothetical protein